jgi:hypothetical protein
MPPSESLKNKTNQNEAQPIAHAAPCHAGAKLHQGFLPRQSVVGTQAKAGAGFFLPVRG